MKYLPSIQILIPTKIRLSIALEVISFFSKSTQVHFILQVNFT